MKACQLLAFFFVLTNTPHQVSAEFDDYKGLLSSLPAIWYRSNFPHTILNITGKHPWADTEIMSLYPYLEVSQVEGIKISQPLLYAFLLENTWLEGEQLEAINSLLPLIHQSPQFAQALEALIKKLKGQRRTELRRLLIALGKDNLFLIQWLIDHKPDCFKNYVSTGFFNAEFFRLLESLIRNNDELLEYFLSLLDKAPHIIRMLLSQPASTDTRILLERIKQTLEHNSRLLDQVFRFPTMGAVLLVHHMLYDWGLPDKDIDDKHLTQLHSLFDSYIRKWMANYEQLDIDINALASTFVHLFLYSPQTMMALFAEIFKKPEWFIRRLLLKLSQLEANHPGIYSEQMILRLIALLGEPAVLELLEKISEQLSTTQLYVLLTRKNEELKQWLLIPDNINHALLGIVIAYGCFVPQTPSPATPGHAALTDILINAMQSPLLPLYLGSELPAIAENMASLLIALFPVLGEQANREGVSSKLDHLFNERQLDVEALMPQVQALLSNNQPQANAFLLELTRQIERFFHEYLQANKGKY